jgi:hypothetical protein
VNAGDRPDPVLPKDDRETSYNLRIILKRIKALEEESDRIKALHPEA